MATATLITIPVYSVNSQPAYDRSSYPFGKPIAFAGDSLQVQPVTGTTVNDYEAGRTRGAALVYSAVRSSATGDTVFYSNLTVAAIVALANA